MRFDLRVTNDGNTPLATVPLSDAFDATALDLRVGQPGGYAESPSAGRLGWRDVGPLAVGASAVVTVTFTAGRRARRPGDVRPACVTGTVDAFGDPAR